MSTSSHADNLERLQLELGDSDVFLGDACDDAIEELRRLEAENAELRKKNGSDNLKYCPTCGAGTHAYRTAAEIDRIVREDNAELAKLRAENTRLKAATLTDEERELVREIYRCAKERLPLHMTERAEAEALLVKLTTSSSASPTLPNA
jgi:hypothetical protein